MERELGPQQNMLRSVRGRPIVIPPLWFDLSEEEKEAQNKHYQSLVFLENFPQWALQMKQVLVKPCLIKW